MVQGNLPQIWGVSLIDNLKGKKQQHTQQIIKMLC